MMKQILALVALLATASAFAPVSQAGMLAVPTRESRRIVGGTAKRGAEPFAFFVELEAQKGPVENWSCGWRTE